MPNKIFGKEIENRAIELAMAGYNANRIAKEIGVSEGTVSSWAKKTGTVLQKRISPETLAKENALIAFLTSGKTLKYACEELILDHRAALKIVEKHGLSHLLRNRAKAAEQDRRLTLEEVNSRLPPGHGNAIGYDKNLKGFIIKRDDGTTYIRISSQIFRGDPNLSKKRRHTEEDIAKDMLKIGYRLILGTYVKKHTPIKAEHIGCGYIRENSIYNFIKQACPRCSNIGVSKAETSISEWIKTLGLEIQKYRFQKDCVGKGKGKEIDIFMPSLNVGIEYCGLFYHGVAGRKRIENGKIKYHSKKDKKYEPTDYDNPKLTHRIKMDKSRSLGIYLITIFENEWKNNKEKVMGLLKAKLGKNTRKVYARKTRIKEITGSEASSFLDLYHLQGAARSIISFGLYLEDELLAVITGNVHHRNNQEFVLNRLCFKTDVTVVGGSSRLSHALEFWAIANGYSEIKTWSDNRWSEGKVYEKMDFSLKEEIPPDYFYFDNKGNIYSKQSCQKKHLIKKGGVGNTEWEMAQSLGYDRIYDCGKKVWVKKLI